MIYSVENEYLKIGVKDYGCELTSVLDKSTGYEFLWQGDPAVWSGQSPILFPIVGRLIDDRYTLDGKEYTLVKHGFARKMNWTFIGRTANALSFRLSDTEETRLCYPYAFTFDVKFSLEEKSLSVHHTVKNDNDHVMYFSFGAHPGFNCEIGDQLVFDQKETLAAEKIDLVHSLLLPGSVPLLNNESTIEITRDIFREDALILHGFRSKQIRLLAHGGKQTVRFDLNGAPYLGIWAKPAAPYVCIEPWFGVNDSQVKKADFSEKNGIVALNAKTEFNYRWTAEFSA